MQTISYEYFIIINSLE